MRKVPASLLKKMEQKTPGTLMDCSAVPHDVEGLLWGLLVFKVR